MKQQHHTPQKTPPVQTVEQTSKRWKLQILLSYAGIITGAAFGMVGYFAGTMDPPRTPAMAACLVIGILIFIVCVIWAVVVQFLIWWFHG